MAKWTDMGHAMRRRIGAPANHLEAAEASDNRDLPTSEEAHSMAKNDGSARIAMGDTNPLDVMSPEQNFPMAGTVVARHNTQAADPTAGGAGGPRTAISDEQLGSSYRITANMSAMIDPAAGATMANAKIVPSVIGRNTSGFMSAVQDSEQ